MKKYKRKIAKKEKKGPGIIGTKTPNNPKNKNTIERRIIKVYTRQK